MARFIASNSLITFDAVVSILPFIWYSSLVIVTGYYLLIFRIRKAKPHTPTETWPGVSVVIAVKNESENLRRILLALERQDYPKYEIIIIDDYSAPLEAKELETMISRLPDVHLFRSDKAPGKKHAVSMGISKAQYSLILSTDADCLPAGPEWIRQMVSAGSASEMVLGYSPYYFKAGRLNAFVRFETVMTGIQYLSWARAGYPYMGVGRNLLFPKAVFNKTDPYTTSQAVPYGDDDLLVQAVKGHIPVNTAIHPGAFVYSSAPNHWHEWISQKHRHLSAARYYTMAAWLQPGIFGVAVILHWMLLVPMLLYHITVSFALAFFSGVLIRWWGYASWTKRLGDADTKWFYPWYEVGYGLYLFLMGLFTLAVKKKTWN